MRRERARRHRRIPFTRAVSIIASCLAPAAMVGFAPAVAGADSPFDGRDVTVTWEYWSGASPGAGGSYLATTDTAVVQGSDAADPDLPGFHSSTGNDFELWDVDFDGSEIRLAYTSIYAQDHDHQYMYLSPVGIHFEDVAGSIAAIELVEVDTSIAPFGFDPSLVHFDEQNIWVDLQGSMCHFGSMGSMPSCTNPSSPTGYDNEIVLTVTVPEPTLGAGAAFGAIALVALARRRARCTQRRDDHGESRLS